MSILKNIRQKMPPGTVLKTPSGVSQFKISKVAPNKVVVEVGKRKKRIPIPQKCFESINDVLDEEKWTEIGAKHGVPNGGTFDEYIQQFTNGVSAASYVTPILEGVGAVEVDRSLPAKVRLSKTSREDPQVSLVESSETNEARTYSSLTKESDLHSLIFSNLDLLEKGLSPVENGYEFSTSAGQIDILANDKNNDLVVIEIKAGIAGDKAYSQISRYIASVREDTADADQKVRGFLIAEDFDDSLKYSIKNIPGLELKKYRVNVDFEDKEF